MILLPNYHPSCFAIFKCANNRFLPEGSVQSHVLHKDKNSKLNKRKKGVQESEGFYSGGGAWGMMLTRGYLPPLLHCAVELNNLISQILLSKVPSVIDFNLRTNLLTRWSIEVLSLGDFCVIWNSLREQLQLKFWTFYIYKSFFNIYDIHGVCNFV